MVLFQIDRTCVTKFYIEFVWRVPQGFQGRSRIREQRSHGVEGHGQVVIGWAVGA